MTDKEKTTKTDYSPTGTWASEAFDFLRLFQRVGGQVQGLILVEIGWTLLLFLAKGISQTDSVPILSMPYPESIWPLKLIVADFRLTTIYTVGATLIAMIWFFTSGLYLYFYMPIKRLLRFLAVALVTILFFIITFIPGIVAIVISFILVRKWEREQGPEKLKQLQEKLGKNYASKAFDLAQKDNFVMNKIVANLIGYFGLVVSYFISTAEIGLAPFYSSSFEEDMKAAKAPMQIFASAIGMLQAKLRYLDDLERISFWSIPNVIKVDSVWRANFIRGWMGFDTLLWGSYLSAEPPLIWMNIEQEHLKDSQKSDSKKELDTSKFDPFPRLLKTKEYLVIVNQDDLLDVYIVLLIALIHTLNSRQDERRRGFFFNVDKLGYSITTEKQIILHLIQDALFSIDKKIDQPVSKEFYPTARSLLVDLAGQWIGHQMDFGGGLGDHFSIRTLREVAIKCVELEPSNANHYYRLAAIECVMGNEKAANEAIKSAQKHDQAVNWVSKYELVSAIDIDIESLDRSLGETSYKLAKIAAMTAQAVALGEYAKSSVKATFVKTYYWQFLESGVTETIEKDEVVSLKIFCSLIALEIPQKYRQQMAR